MPESRFSMRCSTRSLMTRITARYAAFENLGDSPQALAALHLIVAFKHSPMAGQVAVASVDVSAPGVLVAATGQGSQVTFALDHLDQQLRRWRAIYDWGHTVEISSLDLAVGNNIPVKWAEAGNPVMELPKSAKPLHNRRNNV